MHRRNRRSALLIGSLFVLPAAVSAQVPLNATSGTQASTPAVTVAGTPTIDLITLKGFSLSIPLRFGGVIPNSESIDLDSERLVRNVDYQIDYDNGIISLMREQKAGQLLRIAYRYDKSHPVTTTTGSNLAGLPTFKFDLLPGSMSMIMGFGLASRLADGNVMTTNLYGLNNTFKLQAGGRTALNGLFFFGDQQKVQTQSGFERTDKPGEAPAGKSRLILENLTSKMMGGTVSMDYQDVSPNFNAFGAVTGAGYDKTIADQLSKEKGLKRAGFSLNNLNLGGMKLTDTYKSVGNDNGSVDWRTFGLQSGQFKLNWAAQNVGAGFDRFGDLAEADKAQLQKEIGLNRSNLSSEYKSKLATLDYQQQNIQDTAGGSLYQRNVKLDTTKLKFDMGEQNVDQSFTKLGNLLVPEQTQFANMVGLKRQWANLQTAITGSVAFNLNVSDLKSATGDYASQKATLGAKTWNLEYDAQKVAKGFTSLGTVAPTQMDDSIKAIANMYPGAAGTPGDRGAFAQSAGIDRTMLKLTDQIGKDNKLSAETLHLRGMTDGGELDALSLSGKKYDFNFKHQNLGTQFTELTSLMGFERNSLGSIIGLDRTDVGLNLTLNKDRKMAFSTMSASVAGEGQASRQSLSYTDKRFDVSLHQRDVSSGFNDVASLIDPENTLLATLKGFKEQDIKAKWQILPNLHIEAFAYDAKNEVTGQGSNLQNLLFDWKPNKSTQIGFVHTAQSGDTLASLFSNVIDRFSLQHDFGKYGNLKLLTESDSYAGSLSPQPDSKTEYLSYEAKLVASTSVKTEQSHTTYSDGTTQNVNSNTVSSQLSKRAGVSVTETNIGRSGSATSVDEIHRDYGFWFDLGKGIKFNYGLKRSVDGPAGTLNSTVGLTPGTIGGLNLTAANYSENRWDNLHTQGLTNFAFSSAKPLKFGFIKDMKFAVGLDTASDYTAFVKENKLASWGGKIGSNTLAAEYKSQIQQSGFRGIDRSFQFITDQSDKRWLVASIKYKMRDVPDADPIAIRDISFTARPSKKFSITNQLLTNPEDQIRSDALLGSLTSPWRVNKWAINYNPGPKSGIAASWEERLNDVTHESSRIGGITVDLFKTSGSPLSLFYGVEQHWGNVSPLSTSRYWIKFDQKPGPNQVLSLFAGNVAYQHDIEEGFHRNNWALQVNYQLKF